MSRLWITLICLTAPLFGNTPGGGLESGAPDVTLVEGKATVTLSNGSLTATIAKSTGYVSSLLYQGVQLADTSTQGIYYSMHGMKTYRTPSACNFSVTVNTPDVIDICLSQSGAGQVPPFDIEFHYVLRRGDSGIYTYSIVSHPESYPAGSFNIWRLVWKRPLDTFERLYVDDLRNRQMPNSHDYSNASPTSIPEILHFNTGVLAGKDEGKYCYNTSYYDTPVYGHATDDEDIGIWVIYPAHEWFNDGPTMRDLSAAHYGMSCLMNMPHYSGSGVSIKAGESWRKLYGPFLLYCNSNPAGAEACWQDAQAQLKIERAAWPYTWLKDHPDYPNAAGRATVTGSININDPFKPKLDAKGAWVGLAAPDPGGNWQFEGKRYQHWVKAGTGGSFSIPHVRPGAYTLYCFADGATGEFAHTKPVTVTAGQELNLGTLAWNIPRSGTWLAWEIGLPDRDSREFRHGNDYFTPYIAKQFNNEFSNPLIYDVSSSTASNDWNFAQPGYEPDAGPPRSPWPWEIHFNLPALPETGTATLHLALAGSQYARLCISANDNTPIILNPDNNGGNALNRQSSRAKYALHNVDIPISALKLGANTITLLQARYNHADILNTAHVMYDYVALEMPAVPGVPPTDADGDTLPDAWELAHFLTLSSSATEDSDGDSFSNSAEQKGGSDPTDPRSMTANSGD